MSRADTARPAWDSTRPSSPRFQPLLLTVAGAGLLLGLLGTVMRVLPPTDDPTALVASFIPYGLIGYLVCLLALLSALVRSRRRRPLAAGVVAVALLAAWQLAWMAPLFVPDHRPVTTPGFRLMSLNVYSGLADPAQVAVQAEQADVVVLVEATPAGVKGLDRYGWRSRFPYVVGDLNEEVSDTMVYSRLPLGPAELVGASSFQQWVTTVDVPGLGPVTLIAAHPCNPYCRGGRWYAEHARLNVAAAVYLDRPLVVAGDFNAVDDHGPMQRMRKLGLRSVTDLTGAGWLPTWPANRRFPPLLPIDHVMVDRFLTATSVRTFAVSGTDHLGLLTTLAGTG